MLALCLPSRYQSISDIGVGETVESLVSKAVAPELQLEAVIPRWISPTRMLPAGYSRWDADR